MRKISCNLCGGSDSILLFSSRDRSVKKEDPTEFLVVQCGTCGLSYLNPQPDVNELKPFYEGNYYTHIVAAPIITSLERWMLYKIIRWVKRKLLYNDRRFVLPTPLSKGKLLDVGCGKGNYIIEYRKRYPEWEYYGVEPDPNAARIAAGIPSVRISNSTLKDAQFQPDFFDVIFMSHSLEHTSNPRETLAECFRILKQGGVLIIRVPNFGSIAASVFGKYWVAVDVPRHLYHFTEHTLGMMLHGVGFQKVQIRKGSLDGSIINSIHYVLGTTRRVRKETIFSLIGNYIKKPVNWCIGITGLGGELKINAFKERR